MAKATYTLDQQTINAVNELAAAWGVSRSEVIRTAVRQAKLAQLALPKRRLPLEVLKHVSAHPTISDEEARKRMKDAGRLRKGWR
jgi:hypothetical protein